MVCLLVSIDQYFLFNKNYNDSMIKGIEIDCPIGFLLYFSSFVMSSWRKFYKVKMGELLIKEGGLFHSIL